MAEVGSLAGRIAIVTGATAGIGEATAWELARGGAKVVVNGRRAERLDALVEAIDGECGAGTAHAVAGDCSQQTVIDGMLAAARERFGRGADLVVVNAGRGLGGSLLTSDEGQWEEVMRTNIIGASRLMRSAAAEMTGAVTVEEGGKGSWLERAHDIVVLGSTVGRHVSPFSSVYGSSKFAVNSLAEALRREIGPRGVRVSLIEPGIVVTEFQEKAGYTGELVENFHEKFGPLLVSADIARTISWIASQPAHVAVGDVVIRATRQDYP